MDKRKAQALADAYGAGQIKQALLVGEYPPPKVEDLSKVGSREIAHMVRTGVVTGRFSHEGPTFEDVSPTGRIRRTPKDFWPMAYMSGPTKLSDLQHVTPEQARATSKALLGADFSELERRVAAWHAETVENLKAQGYEPAGDGPLADTWIKKET